MYNFFSFSYTLLIFQLNNILCLLIIKLQLYLLLKYYFAVKYKFSASIFILLIYVNCRYSSFRQDRRMDVPGQSRRLVRESLGPAVIPRVIC